jgi:hypothetical protein
MRSYSWEDVLVLQGVAAAWWEAGGKIRAVQNEKRRMEKIKTARRS